MVPPQLVHREPALTRKQSFSIHYNGRNPCCLLKKSFFSASTCKPILICFLVNSHQPLTLLKVYKLYFPYALLLFIEFINILCRLVGNVNKKLKIYVEEKTRDFPSLKNFIHLLTFLFLILMHPSRQRLHKEQSFCSQICQAL